MQLSIPGLTDFEMLLLGAIGTTLVAVGSLILWAIKSGIPQVWDAFKKRNDSSIAATEKTASAVEKIPEAIKSFELALLGVEKRVVERVDQAQDKIVEEISDKRIILLTEKVREKQASSPGG